MFSALSHFVFGSSSLFGSQNQSGGIKTSTWKDKKLCFDLRPHELELDHGEQLIGCFFPIEDVKGNADELGLIKVTNLRLIWICCKKKRVNLSIGWRTVTTAYEQSLKDTLYGLNTSSSLFVLSKYESTKYEFVFRRQATAVGAATDRLDVWSIRGASGEENWNSMAQLRQICKEKSALISHLSPAYLDDPFEVVFKVWQAYKQTHLFRHCRSNLTYLVALSNHPSDSYSNSSGHQQTTSFDLKLSDIQMLPSEEILEVFSHVNHNETSCSVNSSGTLILTNIRILWIDEKIQMRNFSIPYIRIDSIKVKKGDRTIRIDMIKVKQGDRIQVNTHDRLGSWTFVEFQAEKTATINGIPLNNNESKTTAEQIQNLYLLYKSKPRYGPESCDDCINFMSHLRPIETYFDSVDKSMLKAMENFGPEPTGPSRGADIAVSEAGGELTTVKGAHKADDEIERAERDLDGYTTKVISYLNEQPLNMDHELIYSNDLGLAMEKPANGASINSIWRI